MSALLRMVSDTKRNAGESDAATGAFAVVGPEFTLETSVSDSNGATVGDRGRCNVGHPWATGSSNADSRRLPAG